jgi:glutaredoxin 3
MNIFIYTKSGCPNCLTAKKLLKAKGLKFIENDMDVESVRQAFNFAYPDLKQMPQIFIDDQRVGGLLGLQNALKELGL